MTLIIRQGSIEEGGICIKLTENGDYSPPPPPSSKLPPTTITTRNNDKEKFQKTYLGRLVTLIKRILNTGGGTGHSVDGQITKLKSDSSRVDLSTAVDKLDSIFNAPNQEANMLVRGGGGEGGGFINELIDDDDDKEFQEIVSLVKIIHLETRRMAKSLESSLSSSLTMKDFTETLPVKDSFIIASNPPPSIVASMESNRDNDKVSSPIIDKATTIKNLEITSNLLDKSKNVPNNDSADEHPTLKVKLGKDLVSLKSSASRLSLFGKDLDNFSQSSVGCQIIPSGSSLMNIQGDLMMTLGEDDDDGDPREGGGMGKCCDWRRRDANFTYWEIDNKERVKSMNFHSNLTIPKEPQPIMTFPNNGLGRRHSSTLLEALIEYYE